MDHVGPSQHTKNHIFWFLLVCALLMGGAALGIAIQPVPIPAAPVHPPAGVGGIAELSVITHLVSATHTSGDRIPKAHTVEIHPAGHNQWAAWVAVYDPQALRMWQVRVNTAHGTPQAVGKPAMVPVPVASPAAQPTFATNGIDDQLKRTISDTLSGLLTGTPDISRYTSADSTLSPITPPPFVGVELVGITKPRPVGSDAVVLTEINGQRADGVVIGAQYPLALTQHDGRWEVRGILRALPSVTEPQTTPTSEGK